MMNGKIEKFINNNQKLIIDILLIVATSLISLVGVLSIIVNIIGLDTIFDVITIILTSIVLIFFTNAYYLYFFKKSDKYRQYIALPLLIYFSIFFLITSFDNTPVRAGFFISIIFLFFTSIYTRKKAYISITAILNHLVIAVLQIYQILPTFKQNYNFKLLSIISTELVLDIALVSGIIFFVIYRKKILLGRKWKTAEFIFSYNQNTCNTFEQKNIFQNKYLEDDYLRQMIQKHCLSDYEKNIIELLVERPNLTNSKLADIIGCSKEGVDAAIKRIRGKIEDSYGVIKDFDGNEYESNKKNTIKYFSNK